MLGRMNWSWRWLNLPAFWGVFSNIPRFSTSGSPPELVAPWQRCRVSQTIFHFVASALCARSANGFPSWLRRCHPPPYRLPPASLIRVHTDHQSSLPRRAVPHGTCYSLYDSDEGFTAVQLYCRLSHAIVCTNALSTYCAVYLYKHTLSLFAR